MANPPVLLVEANSDRAIALDSVSWIQDPFSVLTPNNLSQDGRSRLMLFAVNLDFKPGEDISIVTAQAEDSEPATYPLAVEYVGRVPQVEWLTQLIIRVPDQMANAGDLRISITLRGVTSNKVIVKIKP